MMVESIVSDSYRIPLSILRKVRKGNDHRPTHIDFYLEISMRD